MEVKDEKKGRVFTVKQLSGAIHFHEQTIYKWIRNRGMPVCRSGEKGGITILWDEFYSWWKKDKNEKWERP